MASSRTRRSAEGMRASRPATVRPEAVGLRRARTTRRAVVESECDGSAAAAGTPPIMSADSTVLSDLTGNAAAQV